MRAHGQAAQQRGRRDAEQSGYGLELGVAVRLAGAVIVVELHVAKEKHGSQHAHHVQERNA